MPASQPNETTDKNLDKKQVRDNDSKTTDITETKNKNENEAKQREDQNKLLRAASKLIFESCSGLKTNQGVVNLKIWAVTASWN